MMKADVEQVVIVGGGTAGWITAAVLASTHDHLRITLIESPEVPTVGVGEGSWPTLRATLKRIGISESDFLSACDASFKQGSRFDGWVDGTPSDRYLHPFAPLPGGSLSAMLHGLDDPQDIAEALTPQPAICDAGLAPKQPGMADYEGALNYGYHLDATKLAALLTTHAVDTLGVTHIRDHVTDVIGDPEADIAAVRTRESGDIFGDLFIDCTGTRSLLLGGHYGCAFKDRSDILFNDTALTLHLPTERDIASQTISTAHPGGWIWDIGLPTRRGVGCVYASRFMSEAEAREQLLTYIGAQEEIPSIRKIAFQSGHRDKFWHRNCVAIGLSAGFLEPLEASAIVLVELSAAELADRFPANRAVMDILADQFNTRFRYRWDRIIDFLKLHYVLSRRDEPYWQAHRDPASWPDRLASQLALWAHEPPSVSDFPHADEIFPAASQAFVLYGMGFETHSPRADTTGATARVLTDVERRTRTLLAGLPTNRALLDALVQTGYTQFSPNKWVG